MWKHRYLYLGSILWVAIGVGIFLATGWADRTFRTYMDSGTAAIGTACELLPANVSAFAYDENFSKDWNILRKSNFYSALKDTFQLRNILEAWKIGEGRLSPFEKWILQFWGTQLIVASSKDGGTLYFLSPIGNREKCIKRFCQMAFSSFGEHVNWKPRRLQNHWYFEADASYFLSTGFHIQFCPIRGVAVMAISRKVDPLLPIFYTAEIQETSLARTPGFSNFFRRGLQRNQLFGFIRLFANEESKNSLGVEWNFLMEREGQAALDVRLAIPSITVTSKGAAQSELLSQLKQPDDLISTIFSWEDAQMVWNECLRYFPAKWIKPVDQIRAGMWWNTYKEYWEPVFEKLGHEGFIGLGDSNVISDKYQIPFPRTVLAFPFTDSEAFLHAMEATVLKCNQESEANLVIRKTVRSYGEYYEVRMGNSTWKDQYGLRQLPVVAFSGGLFILASSEDAMEKVLQSLVANTTKTQRLNIEGIDFQIQMRQAPDTIRILLGALGAFNPHGENVFLSPTTMRSLSEVFSLMKQFGDSHLALTYQPGQVCLRLLLRT